MEIHEVINSLISDHGLKQADIARHANTSQASISRIQNQQQDPKHAIAKRIIDLHQSRTQAA